MFHTDLSCLDLFSLHILPEHVADSLLDTFLAQSDRVMNLPLLRLIAAESWRVTKVDIDLVNVRPDSLPILTSFKATLQRLKIQSSHLPRPSNKVRRFTEKSTASSTNCGRINMKGLAFLSALVHLNTLGFSSVDLRGRLDSLPKILTLRLTNVRIDESSSTILLSKVAPSLRTLYIEGSCPSKEVFASQRSNFPNLETLILHVTWYDDRLNVCINLWFPTVKNISIKKYKI